MNMKKKSLLMLLVIVVAILVVSFVSVTYAWFLSRYSAEYDFVVKADSHIVLRYESSLQFAPGTTQSTESNKILVAKAKSANPISNTLQETPSGLDVFDTSKVAVSANCVRFSATGAYWVGNITESGALSFALSATPENNDAYDLVQYGELSYAVVFDYFGQKTVLYYNGTYYTTTPQVTTPITLPNTATTFATDADDPWYPIPADQQITINYDEETRVIFENGMRLLPNTRFAFRLYVFAAKVDDFTDMDWNGQNVHITATISVPNE